MVYDNLLGQHAADGTWLMASEGGLLLSLSRAWGAATAKGWRLWPIHQYSHVGLAIKVDPTRALLLTRRLNQQADFLASLGLLLQLFLLTKFGGFQFIPSFAEVHIAAGKFEDQQNF